MASGFFLMAGIQVRPRSGAPRVEENEEIEVRNAANVELLWGGKRCDMRFSIFFFLPAGKVVSEFIIHADVVLRKCSHFT